MSRVAAAALAAALVVSSCSANGAPAEAISLRDGTAVTAAAFDRFAQGASKEAAFAEYFGPASSVGPAMIEVPPGLSPVPAGEIGAFDLSDADAIAVWTGTWKGLECAVILRSVVAAERTFSLSGRRFPADIVEAAKEGSVAIIQITASC